ncbi:YueH family protein [Bacillus salacetis]|uniref:YueH family protein n=1 Tax=Bacillus salacetis TaxID=2315464 RepID=UPI003B9DCCD8
MKMITSYEKITISGNKTAEVFLHLTPDKRFIVSIPTIHWSAEFNQKEDLQFQTDKLRSSLNFHLFEGNTDELADAISKLAEKYF